MRQISDPASPLTLVTVNPRFPLWLDLCLHEPGFKGATGRLIATQGNLMVMIPGGDAVDDDVDDDEVAAVGTSRDTTLR